MTITKSIRKVNLDDIIVDPLVQRAEGVDARRVARTNGNFDPNALGTIIVSSRGNGKHVVIDGMHRCAIASAANYTKPLDAIVFSGLTLKEEARLFGLYNDARMPSAISKFVVGVVAGDKSCVAINNILASHGWKVAQAGHPGVLAAADAIMRVYENGGGVLPQGEHAELTERVIELITAAWEHDAKGADAAILLALAQLIGRFGQSIDTKKLVTEMQGTRPGVLIGRARTLRDAQGGTVSAALAKILAGMHNKGRRTNVLPEWVWIR